MRACPSHQAVCVGLGYRRSQSHPVSCRMAMVTGLLSRTGLCCCLRGNKCVPRLCKAGRTPSLQDSAAVNFHFWVLVEVGNYTQLSSAPLLLLSPRPGSLHLFSWVGMYCKLWNASTCLVPGRGLFITCLLTVALDGSNTLLFSGEIYLPQSLP